MHKQGRQAVCSLLDSALSQQRNHFLPRLSRPKAQTIPQEGVKDGARASTPHGQDQIRQCTRPGPAPEPQLPWRQESREGSQEEGTAPAIGWNCDLPSYLKPCILSPASSEHSLLRRGRRGPFLLKVS